MSLIPTEAFFIPCLLTFLVHVEHLSKIEDTVVTIILKCLRNFTGESNSQCPRIDLTLAYNIIKKIAAIIEHYELEQTDLQCLAECLRSLLVNTQSSNIVGVIAESNIFYELRKYVRNE